MPRALVAMLALSIVLPALAAEQGPRLVYAVPKGWKESAEPRPMRLATLVTPERTEVVVTVFGGDVGGNLANINRWRAQVGLDPIKADEIDGHVTKVKLADEKTTALAVDFTGPRGRILAAIIPGPAGAERTWFIRTLGEPEAVGKTKEGFDAMLTSCKFE